jgi:hypothetical protein
LFCEDNILSAHILFPLILSGWIERLLFDDREDLVLTNDHELLNADLDVNATVFTEEDAVSCFDLWSANLTVIQCFAWTDRYDFTLMRLLLSVVGDDDARGGLSLCLKALNDDLIVKGACLHGRLSSQL